MVVIRIPKTPPKAFNKNRPISDLLKGQIEHLEWAIRPAAERSPAQVEKIKRGMPKTEGAAAARIEELTRQLHPQGAAVQPPAPVAAPAPPAASPSGARKRAGQTTRGRKQTKTITKKKHGKRLQRDAHRSRRR